MTLRKLNIYPDLPLKQKVNNSELSLEALKPDIRDLIDTIKHYEGNSFLTTNQIGLTSRIAVLDLQSIFQKQFKEEERYLVMINPEVVEASSNKISIQETSISTPDFQCTTSKSASVKLKFDKIVFKTIVDETPQNEIEENQNEVKVINTKLDFDNFEFESSEITFWERLAFVSQAAIDQLNGKCYLDTVSWYNRESFIKKRRKTVNQFKSWVKSSLMNTRTHGGKLKNAR